MRKGEEGQREIVKNRKESRLSRFSHLRVLAPNRELSFPKQLASLLTPAQTQRRETTQKCRRAKRCGAFGSIKPDKVEKKSDFRNLCGPLAPRPELRSAPFWVHSKAKVFLLFYLTNLFFFARHPRSKNPPAWPAFEALIAPREGKNLKIRVSSVKTEGKSSSILAPSWRSSWMF